MMPFPKRGQQRAPAPRIAPSAAPLFAHAHVPEGAAVLRADDDGLATALEQREHAIRWNARSRRVEIQPRDCADFRDASAEVVDDVMADVAKHCYMQRTPTMAPEPFLLSHRMERRLLGVVARRNTYDGEGSSVYQAVEEWIAGEKRSGYKVAEPLGAIMDASGVLQRFESAARVPAWVAGAVKAALMDHGWSLVSMRKGRGGEPRRLWLSPFGTEYRAVPLPKPKKRR